MDLRVCCKRLECRACAPRLEKPQKYDARCVKKDYKQRIVLGAQKVNEMAVSADAKGRNVKTFYVGQRLVRIRIEPKSAAKMQTISPPIAGEQEPKGRKEAVPEAPKPVVPVIAEEIKPKPKEVKAKPTEVAPAPALPVVAPAAEIKTTATVECPACNKAFDVPIDAVEGACPHCGAELLYEDVVEEPKKEKGKGLLFWKKKSAS